MNAETTEPTSYEWGPDPGQLPLYHNLDSWSPSLDIRFADVITVNLTCLTVGADVADTWLKIALSETGSSAGSGIPIAYEVPGAIAGGYSQVALGVKRWVLPVNKTFSIRVPVACRFLSMSPIYQGAADPTTIYVFAQVFRRAGGAQ